MMPAKILLPLILAPLLTVGPLRAQTGDAADAPAGASSSEAQAGGGGKATEPGGKKIYRIRDEKGNVVYTDEPPEGSDAEEVELKKGNSMSLESAPAVDLPADEDKPEAVEYKVELITPAREQTFQHPTEPIPVRFNVKPEPREGHSVQVMHNGKALKKPELEWPVRGEHSIQVRVVDADGETLAQSETHRIYVHRPSRKIP